MGIGNSETEIYWFTSPCFATIRRNIFSVSKSRGRRMGAII